MIVYREMRREDVPFISRLEEETFSMPWSAASFLQMIEKEDTAYFVAEEDGQLLGGCGLLLIAGEGNITNVVVTPEARRRGVATGLLRYLVEKGDRAGLTAASGLYEKLGFVSEGIRPDFYEKPTEDAVIMWKR